MSWLPDTEPKTWDDYICPVCDGIERASNLLDKPMMHRHRYGDDPLQTGMVLLQRIPRAALPNAAARTRSR